MKRKNRGWRSYVVGRLGATGPLLLFGCFKPDKDFAPPHEAEMCKTKAKQDGYMSVSMLLESNGIPETFQPAKKI